MPNVRTHSPESKTLRGLFWSFFEVIGQQGIQFIIVIFLARQLLPEQFGLIAMLAIFMAVGRAFVDGGFGQALIQKQDANQIDESSIFYFNILVGILAAGLLTLAAPAIATFYGTPVLVSLTRLLSLNLVIGAFGIVQTALLTKHLDFKTQMKVSLIATLLSGVLAIAMAYRGFGVWSLVAQSLGSNVFRTALLWLFHSWRPVWVMSVESLRSMFSFGSKLFFSSLMETVFRNIYLLVIGKVFSSAALGFYYRAQQTQELPATNTSAIIGRVMFPVFSSLQHDTLRLKRGLRKALRALAMVNFPVMIGMATVAKPLVQVLFTEKWLPCVPYLQLLCVVGLLYPVHAVNLNVLVAQGRSDLFFRLEILKKILIVIAVVMTYRWGIVALICGQIVMSCAAYYLNAYYTGRLLDYPLKEQVLDFAPYLAMGAVMGLGVYSVQLLSFPSNLALLVSQVLVGISLYIALCCIFRVSAFVETLEILKDRLKPRELYNKCDEYYG